ncbi:conserved hypothetical protein [Candidatus Desulfarcum epimagneticum]|uniref:Uncharacterized protein n=1 Tax=uncultured Desulfobacteraceae bacterium TaxID=218296 RepID=A0A484HML7_9BACT|nr:conserved hypothetical protein [uncultured Desulfobacteraceae bacterium]
MLKKIKMWVLVALAAAAGYFLLSYHLIYMGESVQFLKKKRLTSAYTFFWAPGKSVEDILSIDTLREAGIGGLLVKAGRLDPKTRQEMESWFAEDPVYY